MKEKLLLAFGGLLDSTIAAVPKVIVGILLTVAALLIAKLIERVLQGRHRRSSPPPRHPPSAQQRPPPRGLLPYPSHPGPYGR